jgi:hypothetical protein
MAIVWHLVSDLCNLRCAAQSRAAGSKSRTYWPRSLKIDWMPRRTAMPIIITICVAVNE